MTIFSGTHTHKHGSSTYVFESDDMTEENFIEHLGDEFDPEEDTVDFEKSAVIQYTRTLEDIAYCEVLNSKSLQMDGEFDYDEWLELTGKDDSFHGDGVKIPSTYELFEAALRIHEENDAEVDISPSP